mmetsp:Transcript_10593/g.33857  ORF Transcript_10593/g.33857 Transcript_10593/m.33857 type:complete len:348 (+) Transcript_10593:102-1145(+)
MYASVESTEETPLTDAPESGAQETKQEPLDVEGGHMMGPRDEAGVGQGRRKGPFEVMFPKLGKKLCEKWPRVVVSTLNLARSFNQWARVVWGLCLVLYGSLYPLTMTTYEVMAQGGLSTTYKAACALKAQLTAAWKADEEDNARDADGDGTADVEELSCGELAARKTHLALSSTDPDSLDEGVSGIYSTFFSVLGALKPDAQTLVLGNGMAIQVEKLVQASPLPGQLKKCMSADVQKWAPHFVTYLTRILVIVSTFLLNGRAIVAYPAVRGGLWFSRGLMDILLDRDLVSRAAKDSFCDEIAGWTLAGFGFWFQVHFRVATVPPVFDILLSPFAWTENFLAWFAAAV